MNKDYISVCLITKDEESHILQTLSHLVNQSYGKENFEIILVDGNSQDNTIVLSRSFLDRYDMTYQIIAEHTYPNKRGGYGYGHSFARNIAIDVTSPKSMYIAQIDADCRADEYWLETLWGNMKDTTNGIAGAGGPRLVETLGDISPFELMLNYYFTSYIMTLGNPAFCVRKGLKYIPSIAGYNSIYKASILKKYMFNTQYATNFDDIEINYRLSKDGYKFLYVPEAKIRHRLEESIGEFYLHMEKYGAGAAKVTKHFKSIPRLYVHLSVGYVFYTFSVLPLVLFVSIRFLLPYFIVFVVAMIVFIENIIKTKHVVSLWVFPLVFVHPFMYGYGFLREIVRV